MTTPGRHAKPRKDLSGPGSSWSLGVSGAERTGSPLPPTGSGQPRERPLLRVYLNTRYRAADVAGDVRWYAAKTTRGLKRAAARWRHRDDDDGSREVMPSEPRDRRGLGHMSVPRPGANREDLTDIRRPDAAPGVTGPGHFGRPHISGSVHDEPAWYQPHAAPDIPQGFWSPPALRDWLPELLEWALTAPLSEIRDAA